MTKFCIEYMRFVPWCISIKSINYLCFVVFLYQFDVCNKHFNKSIIPTCLIVFFLFNKLRYAFQFTNSKIDFNGIN